MRKPLHKSSRANLRFVAASSKAAAVPGPPSRISRGVKEKLAADDVEIQGLERALGIKGTKKLPDAFKQDGLDVLLEGLDDENSDGEVREGKRKRDEGREWLERKRRKAGEVRISSDGSELESSAPDDDSEVFGDFDDDKNSEPGSFESFDEEPAAPAKAPKKARENPYVAPPTSPDAVPAAKYVPPSLRQAGASDHETLQRLGRQIKGLLNRLSEANLHSILNDIEKLFQSNPRQHVSSTLTDHLIGLLNDPTSLQDTFVILHAGFIAAVYKIVGTEFGAEIVRRVIGELDATWTSDLDKSISGKKSTNLVSLLAELYNFQVIGSTLIFDLIRLFLEDLSELNTELLLKVIRNSGPQLRQDDPSSLKDIILLLQRAVAKKGDATLSVRTKFMIETMNNLKNNRMKTGLVASSIASEHTIRMKKILGSLNSRNIKATEPLGVGLEDIRDTTNRGKWWLAGASYKPTNPSEENANGPPQSKNAQDRPSTAITTSDELPEADDGSTDLLRLAHSHRMNTSVRRSIFITLMSSTDYQDCTHRLSKLRLKKSQELEIPKVLLHCCAMEQAAYNPYYTLVAKKLCAQEGRKMRMAFQFCLWDVFKELGEGGDEEEDEDEEEEDGKEGKLSVRGIFNLAKMYGVLVVEGGLGLRVLKVRY